MSQIPKWDQFMVQVLQVQLDGKIRTLRELTSDVSDLAGLTSEQKLESLTSGDSVAANRIAWAISYLYRVRALERPTRANYVITSFGHELLQRHPAAITEADLRAVARPGDEWWIARDKQSKGTDAEITHTADENGDLDPIEMIGQATERLHNAVKAELIDRMVALNPAFFEQAVVKLLVAMGYGGTGGEAAATRLVNDGGIDGVIDQDVLGLSKVYVQAKRYARENSVGRPEVQAFVGALSGKADQGVLITTGRFSSGAREYAERDARVRIILIDGIRLVDLMVKYRVGVQIKQSIDIVQVDEDFFE